MMKRFEISATRMITSVVLLVLSGPICLVHRFLNNNPPHNVNWIIFDPKLTQDVQWYVADTGDALSHIFVIFAVWLVSRKIGYIFHALVTAKLLVYLLDLAHYWTYYRRNEYFVFVQALIYLVVFVKIFKKYVTTSSNSNEKAY